MSQLTRTVFRSCGLTVGWNMAPPPPGPTTRKLPGRGESPAPFAKARNPRSARRKKSVISFLCFPYHSFRFLSWQNPLALSIPFISFLLENASDLDLKEPGGVLVVDLLEDFIGQTQPINPPPSLRRHLRRRVIEILVFGFQKPVIDLVQQVSEDLLRRISPVRNGVGSKQDSILIFVKELSGHARLAPKLSDAGAHLHVHIRKAIHAFAHVRKIFGVIPHVKNNELRLGMALQNAVARFQNFRVAWKILPMKRPIRMIVQFLEALVEAIDGQKESFRIRNVDRHRN